LSEFRPATARTNHRPRHSVFNDYSGLLAALRLRAEDQKIVITSPDVAKVSGLADALVAKILSPKMPRRLSFQSMHPKDSRCGTHTAERGCTRLLECASRIIVRTASPWLLAHLVYVRCTIPVLPPRRR
jgi:hypothetical protein